MRTDRIDVVPAFRELQDRKTRKTYLENRIFKIIESISVTIYWSCDRCYKDGKNIWDFHASEGPLRKYCYCTFMIYLYNGIPIHIDSIIILIKKE